MRICTLPVSAVFLAPMSLVLSQPDRSTLTFLLPRMPTTLWDESLARSNDGLRHVHWRRKAAGIEESSVATITQT
jgi:hypothetical protein